MNKVTLLPIALLSLAFTFQKASAQTQQNTLKLKVNGNGYSDETILRFIPGATENFDGNFDAWKLFSINPNVPSLYTEDSSGTYAINSFPLLTADLTKVIRMDAPDTGSYTFDFTIMYAFDSDVIIIFEDSLNQQFVDVHSASTYSFHLSSINQVNLFPGRFKIHIYLPPQITVAQPACLDDSSMAIITKAGSNNWSYTINDGQHQPLFNKHANQPSDSLLDLDPATYELVVNYHNAKNHKVLFEVVPGKMVKAGFEIMNDTNAIFVNEPLEISNHSINCEKLLWDFGDDHLYEQEIPTHQYALPGRYEITLTVTNGACSVAHQQHVFINELTTGIGEATRNESMKLYYANGAIRMSGMLKDKSIEQVMVYTLSGKLILQKNINREMSGVDLPFSRHATGIYFCVVQFTDNTTIQEKLFIQ